MKTLKPWGWASVVVAGLIIGALTWLVVGHLVGREVVWWGLALTFVVIVAATLAQWFVLGDKDDAGRRIRFSSPNGLARLGISIFFGLGAGLFVQQFVQPTEFDRLRELLERIAAQTAPKPWRAFDNIDGHWGEERRNCEAVYRFERQDHGLTITVVKGAAIIGDYRMTASIAPGGEGDILRATLRSSTEADETHGQALVFTYHDDGGGYRRLDWLNETRSNAGVVKLEPCEAPR